MKTTQTALRLRFKIRNNRQETANTAPKETQYMLRFCREPRSITNLDAGLASFQKILEVTERKKDLSEPLCDKKRRILFAHLDDNLLFRR